MATIRELITKFGFDVNDKPLRALDSNIENIKSSLFKLTAIAGSAAAGVGFLLNEAGAREQTLIAFETMLGSMEKAKSLMSEITKFADVTPFDTNEVIKATKGLLAFGVAQEDLIKKTEILGNIASGVGKDKFGTLVRAFGKIKTKGKGTMEELNMFLEAGVPILDSLAKGMGVTKQEIIKMVSQGKVGFSDVDKALTDLATGNGKFAGLMAKQSKSYLGLISTIQGVMQNFSAELGKSLLPQAKEMLSITLKWFSANKKLIKVRVIKFIKDMVKFIGNFVSVLMGAFKVLKAVTNVFGGLESSIKLALDAMLLFLGANMLSALGNMGLAIFSLITGMKNFKLATMLANAQALLIPLLIGAGIATLLLAIEDIVAFFNGEKSVTAVIMNKFGDMFIWLKGQWTSFGDWISQKFVDWFITPLDNVLKKISEFSNLLNVKANGVLSKFGFDNVFSTTPASNTAQSIGSAGQNQTSNDVKIDAPITISVPEGTNQDQVADVVRQSLSDNLSELFINTKRQISTPIAE